MPEPVSAPTATALPADVLEFLRTPGRYAVIGTVDPDGRPRQVLVWYRMDGETVLVTGATSGLGVQYMARKKSHSPPNLAPCPPGDTPPQAACAVRDITAIRCFSPTKANREKFSHEMSELLGVPVSPVDSPEDAI